MRRLPRFIAVIPALVLLATACAHSVIIPFQPPGAAPIKANYPPVPPEQVGIYRSTHPFDDFLELGLIAYSCGSFDLPGMFNQLRKDAGAHGAQDVVDVKFHSDTRTELVNQQVCHSHTECDANGNCTDHQDCEMITVPQTVTTFTIEGSMIRRKS